MKCHDCGGPMAVLDNQEYHFTECGLDYVYLKGVRVWVCRRCDTRAAEVPSLTQLHLMIALHVVRKAPSLRGQEIRFLRKALGMKAKELAAQLGYNPSTFSRFENDKDQLGEQGERSLRLLYLVHRADEIRRLNQGALSAWVVDSDRQSSRPLESRYLLIDPADLRAPEWRPQSVC